MYSVHNWGLHTQFPGLKLSSGKPLHSSFWKIYFGYGPATAEQFQTPLILLDEMYLNMSIESMVFKNAYLWLGCILWLLFMPT